MKKLILFSILTLGLILSSILNPVFGQTRKNMPQHHDTTKMKDPINRMHDSTKLKEMMRDSNVMKNPHQLNKGLYACKKRLDKQ